jgi:hypothetical protein
MNKNIIQCAVYINKYEYGGGCWYIPIENHVEILKLLKDNYYEENMSTKYDVFYMDINYLNKVYDRNNDEETGLYWWDGTYNE